MNTTEKASFEYVSSELFSEKICSLCSGFLNLTSLNSNSLDTKPTLLIAFSGGCDSLALLSMAVSDLGSQNCFPVYVNHNLRSQNELEDEIELNKINCKKLGVNLEVVTLQKGEVENLSKELKCGIEEAARILRYKALEEKRSQHSCFAIATAHHKQDQIETVAMRLSAGSPVSSLRGISPHDSKKHLIRPLLGFERTELEEYLSEKGLRWSEDSTNKDVQFLRNKFRNEVLPTVRRNWPVCNDYLLSLSQSAARLFNIYDEQKLQHSINVAKTVGFAWTKISVLEEMNPASRMSFLFLMWDLIMGTTELPTLLALRVIQTIEDERDCLISANCGTFFTYNGILGLYSQRSLEKVKENAKSFEYVFDPLEEQNITLPYDLIFQSGAQAVKTLKNEDENSLKKALFLDNALFKGTVRIRFPKAGDAVRLKSGLKTVSRLLQDMKIPPFLRSLVPVIEDDDGICAVFGSPFGGVDRICVKFRTSLAPNRFTLYIVRKG